MNLSDQQRAIVEDCLDKMALELRKHELLHIDLDVLYQKAVGAVRELPTGVRRQRVDRLQRRNGPQMPIPTGYSPSCHP